MLADVLKSNLIERLNLMEVSKMGEIAYITHLNKRIPDQ